MEESLDSVVSLFKANVAATLEAARAHKEWMAHCQLLLVLHVPTHHHLLLHLLGKLVISSPILPQLCSSPLWVTSVVPPGGGATPVCVATALPSIHPPLQPGTALTQSSERCPKQSSSLPTQVGGRFQD